MSRTPDKDILEIAAKVDDMFQSGKTDVSVTDIGAAILSVTLASDLYELIRSRLHRIRDVLVETYGHEVTPVNDTFFACYLNSPPKDIEEAKRCLPMGNGNRTQGLRCITNKDDLIYQASLDANLATSDGKSRKNKNRIVTAVQNGQLGVPLAAHMLKTAQARSQPDNSAYAEAIIGSLESERLQLAAEKAEEGVPGLPE